MSAIPDDFLKKTAQLSAEVTKPFPKSHKQYVTGSRPDLACTCSCGGAEPAGMLVIAHQK